MGSRYIITSTTLRNWMVIGWNLREYIVRVPVDQASQLDRC